MKPVQFENIVKEYFPIIITMIGAAFGAFFAVVKTKTEKRWSERYDAFNSIVYSANVIKDGYEILMTERDVNGCRDVVSVKEWEILHTEMIDAKMKLRKEISKLQLLVKEKNMAELIDSYSQLVKAFERLALSDPQEYVQDYMWGIIEAANRVIGSTIKISRLNFI